MMIKKVLGILLIIMAVSFSGYARDFGDVNVLGDLGVGTTTPTVELQVVGDFILSKSITTGEAATLPTVNLTGGQIAFPASPSSSADVNTLDEYEEGSYVVVVTSGTGGYTLSGTSNSFFYTKTGRIVQILGTLSISSEDSPTSILEVTLPFTPTNLDDNAGFFGHLTLHNHGGSIPNGVLASVLEASAVFEIVTIQDNGTFVNIDKDDVDTAWLLTANFFYITE